MIDIKMGSVLGKSGSASVFFLSVHVYRIRPGTCYQMQHPVVNENKLGL